ncbi:MAG: signal peptidase I [Gemmatimonadetes bacterium]|nr:signal peptidase I [Gemmatimonadota bacterium]
MTEKKRRTPPRRTVEDGSFGKVAWEWTKSLAVAFVLFLLIRTFLVQAFKIPTGSMEDTLLIGDFLLVNKAVYGAQIPGTHVRLPGFDEVKRGDIVVFVYPDPYNEYDPDPDYVKRIVGAPGDTIEMREKALYVNGERQVEPYVRHVDGLDEQYRPQFKWQSRFLAPGVDPEAYRPSRDDWGPLVVPPGHYFVMGDNRDNSADSRYWGFVPELAIKGQPLIVYFSKDTGKPIPWLDEIRFGRIGSLIH